MEKRSLSLQEIQQGSYQVLKIIDKICREQKLTYFLTYGTLIGAIRHKGIIPWDDDIDIMMPRPDYEKLKKYFKQHREELKPYTFFDNKSIPDYPHMIARISDSRYHLIFDNEKDYGIGLFVDIYPLDGVGNDLEYASKLINKTKKLASLCFLTGRKSYSVDNTASVLKMAIKFPAYIWAKMHGNKYYINKLMRYTKLYQYKESDYVACIAWPAGAKNGKDRDVFSKEIFIPMEAEFEDGVFWIPKGYHEFLTTTYGDYMKPPSEKGKKVHHAYHAVKK